MGTVKITIQSIKNLYSLSFLTYLLAVHCTTVLCFHFSIMRGLDVMFPKVPSSIYERYTSSYEVKHLAIIAIRHILN